MNNVKVDFDHQDNHKTYTVEAKAGDFIIGEVRGTVGIVDVDSVDLWSLLVSNLLIAPEASSCNSYQLLSLQVGKIDVNNGQTLEVIDRPTSNFQKSTKPTSPQARKQLSMDIWYKIWFSRL